LLILQALLVLDADGIAAEIVGDAQRRHVHLALLVDLLVGEIGFRIRAGGKFHALVVEPAAHAAGFFIAHLPHFGEQRRLAEALLEDAGRMQQFIRDDGVVHAHAAFVEDAHDRFALPQFVCQATPELLGLGRQLEFR
jgi:hypothetical protein